MDPERVPEFIKVMRDYGRVRRRDGASRWGICRDIEASDRYLETFVVSSWAEHLRQHDRLTRADSQLEERLRSCKSVSLTYDTSCTCKPLMAALRVLDGAGWPLRTGALRPLTCVHNSFRTKGAVSALPVLL